MKCKKTAVTPKEELPPITQSGADSFGCLVNDIVWLPKSKFPYLGLTATIQFDILNLHATKSDEGVVFGITNLTTTGTYSLNTGAAEYSIADKYYKSINGNLIITRYDKINKILSGTFNFTGKNSIGSTIEIKEGRFDLRFTT